MEKTNHAFDDAFNTKLEGLQRSDEGIAALGTDWRDALRQHMRLTASQVSEIDGLNRTSVVIIQRQVRKSIRHGGKMQVSSNNQGVHTFSIVGGDIHAGVDAIVVCDRRGDGRRKCRWFPEDRNTA